MVGKRPSVKIRAFVKIQIYNNPVCCKVSCRILLIRSPRRFCDGDVIHRLLAGGGESPKVTLNMFSDLSKSVETLKK